MGQSAPISAKQLAFLEAEVVIAGFARHGNGNGTLCAAHEARIILAHHPDCDITEGELAAEIIERAKHRGLVAHL